MITRTERLAQRIEQGAASLVTYAQELSDAQWQMVVPSDGRQVGFIIHHVASVYSVESVWPRRLPPEGQLRG